MPNNQQTSKSSQDINTTAISDSTRLRISSSLSFFPWPLLQRLPGLLVLLQDGLQLAVDVVVLLVYGVEGRV